MIPPQIPQMQGELYQANMLSDLDDRMKATRRWWDKWVKQMHVVHSFDRYEMHKLKGDFKRYREHCHRQMFFKVADELFKTKYCVIEEDYEFDHERPLKPMINDKLTILILGAE